jgi:glyoxylase-like metal-dependent hydrolase (beta-lactamase superfamily II)
MNTPISDDVADRNSSSPAMSQVHRFRVGEFECCSLTDGGLDYDPADLFANAPKPELEGLMRRDGLPLDHVTTPFTCLLLKRGDQLVLIDTGTGSSFPSAGRLIESLRVAGTEPADVGTVVITHGHPDHLGGNLNSSGQLAYPNAVFYLLREEWNFWMSDASAAAPRFFVDFARTNLEPVKDRVVLLSNDQEILPGIRAVAAIGHTPGHMAVSVTSGSAQLLHVADTVIYPWHLERPDWVPVFDLVPEEAAKTKRRIFDRAAAEGCLVFAHHFPPFPATGHIARTPSGWEWEPSVVTNSQTGGT